MTRAAYDAQLDHETEKICTGPTFHNTIAREAHHRDTRQHDWPPGRRNAHEGERKLSRSFSMSCSPALWKSSPSREGGNRRPWRAAPGDKLLRPHSLFCIL